MGVLLVGILFLAATAWRRDEDLNDFKRAESNLGYITHKEYWMNRTPLIAGLALVACFSVATLPVQAATDPAKTVHTADPDSHDYSVGDKAPDKYSRKDAALANWQSHGLKAPEKESQWVEFGGKYVLVQTTNSVILDIVAKKK
jgi:Ni/Co efflux regulator RcnB